MISAIGRMRVRPITFANGQAGNRSNSFLWERFFLHASIKEPLLSTRCGDQIKDLTERARETNHLIAGLQKMLTPRWRRPDEPPFRLLVEPSAARRAVCN